MKRRNALSWDRQEAHQESKRNLWITTRNNVPKAPLETKWNFSIKKKSLTCTKPRSSFYLSCVYIFLGVATGAIVSGVFLFVFFPPNIQKMTSEGRIWTNKSIIILVRSMERDFCPKGPRASEQGVPKPAKITGLLQQHAVEWHAMKVLWKKQTHNKPTWPPHPKGHVAEETCRASQQLQNK